MVFWDEVQVGLKASGFLVLYLHHCCCVCTVHVYGKSACTVHESPCTLRVHGNSACALYVYSRTACTLYVYCTRPRTVLCAAASEGSCHVCRKALSILFACAAKPISTKQLQLQECSNVAKMGHASLSTKLGTRTCVWNVLH